LATSAQGPKINRTSREFFSCLLISVKYITQPL
jgi:hypothetical protein